MASEMKQKILEEMKNLNQKHRSIDAQIRGGPAYRRGGGDNGSPSSPRGRGNIRDRLGPRVSPRLGNNRSFAERGLRGHIRRRGDNVPLRRVRGDNRNDQSPSRVSGLASGGPRKRRLMSSVASETAQKDDGDDDENAVDDNNVADDPEDKEADASSETPPAKKKKIQRRDRRMFGNLMAHLGRARKDLTKNRRVTEIREKVEKQVLRKQNEEKQKLRELESTMNLQRKEELKQEKLEVLKQKDELRLKLMKIEWQEHRAALGKFLQTKTKPHLFFVPAKHNDKTKEMLAERKKQVAAEVALAMKVTDENVEGDSKKDHDNKDGGNNDNENKNEEEDNDQGSKDEHAKDDNTGKNDQESDKDGDKGADKEASADEEENNANKKEDKRGTKDAS